MPWKPISTAPRDRGLLVGYRDHEAEHMFFAFWSPLEDEWLNVADFEIVQPTHWLDDIPVIPAGDPPIKGHPESPPHERSYRPLMGDNVIPFHRPKHEPRSYL